MSAADPFEEVRAENSRIDALAADLFPAEESSQLEAARDLSRRRLGHRLLTGASTRAPSGPVARFPHLTVQKSKRRRAR